MRYLVPSLLALALVLPLGAVASARDDALTFPVEVALNTSVAKQKLRNVPIFMAGQKHDTVVHDMGVFRSSKGTRAIGRTDQEACNVAFLSALISLQQRVGREGGDAVVDVKSVTDGVPETGPGQFGCRAGATVARVSVEGRVVSFK